MRPLFKQVARRGFRDGSLWEKAPPGWYIGTASPEMTMYRFTAEDGASLAYRDEGAGLPLLCLPGLTRSMADFDYLIPRTCPCPVDPDGLSRPWGQRPDRRGHLHSGSGRSAMR